MSDMRSSIPKGKTRVIVKDVANREEYLVKDCDTLLEAFELADYGNSLRVDSMDDVYYAFNDEGNCVRVEVGGFGVAI